MRRTARLAATVTVALAMLAPNVVPAAATDLGVVMDHGPMPGTTGGEIRAAGLPDWVLKLPPVMDLPGTATAACPDAIQPAEFDDVSWSATHARAIDCLAWWGVSVGGRDNRYGLNQPVQRDQNASFLVRTLEHARVNLPAAVKISDVLDSNVHAGNIGRLVAGGIARLDPTATFRPSHPLRRDDMAIMLVAAYEQMTGDTARPGTVRFRDLDRHPDGTVIEKAAQLGFTSGVNATTFDPAGTVTRGQMASFLTRLLDRLVTDGTLTVPAVGAWGSTPPGRNRYLPLPSAPEGTYAFLEYGEVRTTEPLRYNPCRPIGVYADYTGAHTGAEKALKTAIARMTSAMGTPMVYGGTTDKIPTQAIDGVEYATDDAHIKVIWPAEWQWGGAIGIGGSWNDGMRLLRGDVEIRRDHPLTHDELTSLLMHELGHAVNLDHAEGTGQIMFPVLQADNSTTEWGNGDLAGLARVGRAAGCQIQTDWAWNMGPVSPPLAGSTR